MKIHHRFWINPSILLRACLAALWLNSLCLVEVSAAEAKSFVQDRFVIGFWVPPQATSGLEQRYKEIAEANFTLVVGSTGNNPTQQLDYCEKFGLKALINVSSSLETLSDHAACWGYLLQDEPSTAEFDKLARQTAEVRKRRPGKIAYINLFPNYASQAQLGSPTYEEHVSRFLQTVKPEVLSMDHYPLMREDRDTRDAYRSNLEVFRRESLKAGILFWNYFYSMPFGNRMDPTEAQIRWQIFTSIAYGAKGVLYFCYWTPGKGAAGAGEFPKGGAIITAEGLKTRHYDQARRINAELKNLGPVLIKLTSTGTFFVSAGQPIPQSSEGGPVAKIELVKGDPSAKFSLGFFKHTDGRRAVVMANDSYAQTAWPTVTFDAKTEDVMEVDKETGETKPVVDDSPELPGLQLSFGAGDGRLFLLPASGNR